MLKLSNLNVCYGAIHAIHDVSLEVKDGEIVSLIGANGAGKTTILRSITGLHQAKSGSVEYNGQDLLKNPAKQNRHPGGGPCAGGPPCISHYDCGRKPGNGSLYGKGPGAD